MIHRSASNSSSPAWLPLREKMIARGMPTEYSDEEMQIWMAGQMAAAQNTVTTSADLVMGEIEAMRAHAQTLIDTTAKLETMLDSFNERGGFEEITDDQGHEFRDIPDFCVRELGLTSEFVETFLIDDEQGLGE